MSCFLRCSCCALGVVLLCELCFADSSAHGERLPYRKNLRASLQASLANYNDRAPAGRMPTGMSEGTSILGDSPAAMDWGLVGQSGPSGCNSCDVDCVACDDCCVACDDGCGPSNGCCYEAECGVPCDCGPARCGPRIVMYGDYLYLQPTDADVAHAQQQDGIGGAGTVPYGEIGTIGQDFHSGFRVGGLVACGPCSAVTMSFTHFESDSSSSLEAPDVPGGGGAVGSLVHHPGAALTASVGPVDASYDIDFQLADVMWWNVWRRSPCYTVNYSLGVQFGHLDQDFEQSGIFGGGLGGAVDTSTSIEFDGGGLKAGIDAERQFKRGLGVYGRLTAAAMTGRFSSRYAMFNQSTDQMLALANWKDDRVIGHIEYEVGMSITSRNDHWRAAAGYMFSYWTNTVTTPEFIDAVQADNYTDVGDTLGFNGLVGRTEFRW